MCHTVFFIDHQVCINYYLSIKDRAMYNSDKNLLPYEAYFPVLIISGRYIAY